MAGLEEVGVPGPAHLRESLTNCSDPLAAIEEFQVQNGILLPSLRPALHFLDLHSIQRLDFHTSVLEELRERLLQRINEIGESDDKAKHKLLQELLNKCFPVIKVKSLRPVVMCIMQHIPKIKLEYLTVVMDTKELYNDAAVEVKQQIWQDNQALFGDEVSPLLARYIEEREKVLYNVDNLPHTFYSPSPKARRNEEVVQQLAKMVGKNIKLYDMVLQFLRTLFLRTRNIHYCTLRAELLMSLRDSRVQEIHSIDPCDRFNWCLDACIHEKFVDGKRARELQGFLDGMRRGHEQVLGDLAMILCDPHSINTVASSCMNALNTAITAETIPRHSEEMILLLRMLSLGLGAWDMIDSQVFKEPKLDSTLITRYLPCLLSMMVDDQLNSYKGNDHFQTEPVPGPVKEASHVYAVPATLLLYYTVNALKQRDLPTSLRALPLLATADTDTVYSDVNLHLLVAALARVPEYFSRPEFCEVVFDRFFLRYLSNENVLNHLLRLLWAVHPKVIPIVLETLISRLKPPKQVSELVKKLYAALVEKINTFTPSPIPEPEKLDSPLMSVPAPTPAHPGLDHRN